MHTEDQSHTDTVSDQRTGDATLIFTRILVIDDNVEAHADFERIFAYRDEREITELESILGFDPKLRAMFRVKIDTAIDAETGIDLVRKSLEDDKPYDVIFIDVRMPRSTDGVQATKQILQLDPRVHCVICSAFTDYTWEDIVDQIGIDDRWLMLRKPFDVIEIRQMVLSLSEKRRLAISHNHEVQSLKKTCKDGTKAIVMTQAKLRDEIQIRANTEAALERSDSPSHLGNLASGSIQILRDPLAALLLDIDALKGELNYREQNERSRALLDDITTNANRIRHTLESLGKAAKKEGSNHALMSQSQDLPLVAKVSDGTPSSASVLVVEDDPLVLRSLKRVLGMLHVDFAVAHNGLEALNKCEGNQYELILSDLFMTDVSGAEFYKALKSQGSPLADRIVFLTGGAHTKEATDFLSNIPNKVVEKPFTVAHIQQLLEDANVAPINSLVQSS